MGREIPILMSGPLVRATLEGDDQADASERLMEWSHR